MDNSAKTFKVFGTDRVKVICVECANTFPAIADWLDLNNSGYQLYRNCPTCNRPTKVKIIVDY